MWAIINEAQLWEEQWYFLKLAVFLFRATHHQLIYTSTGLANMSDTEAEEQRVLMHTHKVLSSVPSTSPSSLNVSDRSNIVQDATCPCILLMGIKRDLICAGLWRRVS